MRTVLVMAMKDLQLITRDWLGLFFIIGFPILIAVFFGAMYGWVGTGSVKLRAAVVDEDNSDISRKFVANLQNTGNVDVEQLARDEAMDKVRRGDLVGLIALPRGFGETVGIPWRESPAIEVGVDPARKAEAGLLEGLVMQSAGKLMMDRFQDPAAMRPLVHEAREEVAQANDIPDLLRPVLLEMMDALDKFMESWQRVDSAEANSETRDSSPGNMAGFQLARIETIDVTRQIPADSMEALIRKLHSRWDISFPQAMVWGVLACAAGFAISIVRERKQGTLLRLQVAPISWGHIVAGKATACFLAVLTVILVLTALGTWLGMRPLNWPMLSVSAVCVAFCFVGVMMLMSVIGKSEETVSGAAWMTNMVMAMFGGGMIPLVFMPRIMQTLSNLSP